jgi:hypothetical protein
MKISVREGHRHQAEVSSRCPQQNLVHHGPGYEPDAEDADRIRRGAAVFVSGRALAKAEFICRELGGAEGFWYCTAAEGSPIVLDLLLPRQQVSGSYCHVDGREVLRAEREARRRGQRIVGAGHSHGRLGLFSSSVDEEQVEQLVKEGAALASTQHVPVEGQVRRLEHHDEKDAGAFEATFPTHAARAVFHLGNRGFHPEATDPRVRLELPMRRTVSFFSTSTADGQHLFPVVEALSCTICGSSQLRKIAPRDVAVHVVGDVAITAQEEASLRTELRAKVERLARGWRGDFADGRADGYEQDRVFEQSEFPDAWGGLPAPFGDQREGPGMVGRPAPFEVYRRGRYVATLPAALVEEAAARCGPLAAALGWSDPDEPGAERRG